MAELEKVIKGLEFCTSTTGCTGCPYEDPCHDIEQRILGEAIMRDVLELLKEQQAEIERLKAEKNHVIEQIESEIHRLFKECGCVKDDVGIAQYQWLINGYQSVLDMIKDGEQG